MFYIAAIGVMLLGSLIIFYRELNSHNNLRIYRYGLMPVSDLKTHVENIAGRTEEVSKSGAALHTYYLSKNLKRAYRTAQRRLRLKQPLSPYLQLTVENYNMLADKIEGIKKDIKASSKLPHSKNVPRLYRFCLEVIKHTRAGFSSAELEQLLNIYQSVTPMYYNEIINLKTIMSFTLIEFIVFNLKLQPVKNEDKSLAAFVGISNAVKCMKNLNDLVDFEFFCSACKFYEILTREKSGVFLKMQKKSRRYYMEQISHVSERYNIKETQLSKTLVALADESEGGHIGEYLFDKRKRLIETARGKKIVYLSENARQKLYVYILIASGFLISTAIMFLFRGGAVIKMIVGQLAFFVSANNAKIVVNSIVAASVGIRTVPRLEISDIEKSDATLVMLTKTAATKEDVLDGYNKLYNLSASNEYKNVGYALTLMLSRSDAEFKPEERELIDYAEKLLASDKISAPYKYCFFARRQSNGTKNIYDARRGASIFCDVINFFQNGATENFLSASGDRAFAPKYLVTLSEADTLMPTSLLELVAAMKHPQNKKYNIIALTEKVNPVSTVRTGYTELFSKSRGLYTDAQSTSDVYHNVFMSDVFDGSGIIRMGEFGKIYAERMPSHRTYANFTLISGFAGTAKMNDVFVYRAYPSTFARYCARIQSYIYGSMQLLPFIYMKVRNGTLKSKQKPLYGWILFDNINVSMINFSNFALLVIASCTPLSLLPVSLVLSSIFLIPLVNMVVQIAAAVKGKTLRLCIGSVVKSFLRGIYSFVMLPYLFLVGFNAILTAILNLITGKNRLPAPVKPPSHAQEKELKQALKNLLPNFITAAAFVIIALTLNLNSKLIPLICAAAWIFAILIYYPLNQKITDRGPDFNIINKTFLRDTAKNTYLDFERLLTEENNYLAAEEITIPDKKQSSYATPQSIGLSLNGVISAYDLKLIDGNRLIDYLHNIIQAVYGLEMWRGHLYGRYDIKSKSPATEKYVSSLESGNFIACLLSAKTAIENIGFNDQNPKITLLLTLIDKIIKTADFASLFSRERDGFYLGYYAARGEYTAAVYRDGDFANILCNVVGFYKGAINYDKLSDIYENASLRSDGEELAHIFIRGLSPDGNKTKGVEKKRLAGKGLSMSGFSEFGMIETVEIVDKVIVRKKNLVERGIALSRINNLLNGDIFKNRFSDGKRIDSINFIEKSYRQTVKKEKNTSAYSTSSHSEYAKTFSKITSTPKYNALTNGNYTCVTDETGAGISSYKGIVINKLHGVRGKCGSFIYLKDTKGVVRSAACQPCARQTRDYKAVQLSYKNVFVNNFDDCEIVTQNTLCNNMDGEIRLIKIRNKTDAMLSFEGASFIELSLSRLNRYNGATEDDTAVELEVDSKRNAVIAIGGGIFIAHTVVEAGEGGIDFCIDKNDFFGNGDINAPAFKDKKRETAMFENPFAPIMSIQTTITVPPRACAEIAFITIAADDKKALLSRLRTVGSYGFVKENIDNAEAFTLNRCLSISDINSYEKITRTTVAALLTHGASVVSGKLSSLLKSPLNALNELSVGRKEQIALVLLDTDTSEVFIKTVLSALSNLYKSGFNFNIVFLYGGEKIAYLKIRQLVEGTVKQLKECYDFFDCGRVYIYGADELSEAQKSTLRAAAALTLDGESVYNDEPSRLEEQPEEIFNVGNFKNTASSNKGKSPERNIKNVLTSKNFGAINSTCQSVTFAEGVFLTKPDNGDINNFSEIVYVADKTANEVYTLTSRPIAKNDAEYFVKNKIAQTCYSMCGKRLTGDMSVYLSPYGDSKIYDIRLTNASDTEKDFAVTLFLEINNPAEYSLDFCYNTVEIYNIFSKQKFFIYTPDKDASIEYSFSSEEFIGRLNDKTNPQGASDTLKNDRQANDCTAFKVSFTIAAAASKRLQLVLDYQGYFATKDAISGMGIDAVKQSGLDYFKGLDDISVSSDDKNLNALVNKSLMYEILSEQNLFNCGFCLSTASDKMLSNIALVYYDTAIVKNNVMDMCRHQLLRGDMKFGFIKNIFGESVKITNNHLLLPLSVCEYIEATGDGSILEEIAPYIKLNGLSEEIAAYGQSEISEQIYNHCIRAIRYTKFSSGGIGVFKNGGVAAFKGGVYQGLMHYYVVKRFLKYVLNRNLKMSLIARQESIKAEIKNLISQMRECEEKNDLIMWSYIAGVLEYDGQPDALLSVEQYIENKITDAVDKKINRFKNDSFSLKINSAVLYRALVSRMLGININGDKIVLRPALAKNLSSAAVSLKYRGKAYDINLKRTGSYKLIEDGLNYLNINHIATGNKNPHREITVEF